MGEYNDCGGRMSTAGFSVRTTSHYCFDAESLSFVDSVSDGEDNILLSETTISTTSGNEGE